MQEFFGLKTLITFIYDVKRKAYIKAHVELLTDVAAEYHKVTHEGKQQHLQSAKDCCLRLESASPLLFNEWYG